MFFWNTVYILQYTKLGRKLCEEIVHQEDATLAKNRIKQLVQFYRNMPCLIQLARSQRFSWTVEDLLELTGAGGLRRVVSHIDSTSLSKFSSIIGWLKK